MANPLPIPPINIPVFDQTTGGINIQWQNYFTSIANAIGAQNIPPIDAQYWTSHSDPSLTNERNIGSLSTGYLKITTAVGTATPSTTATIPFGDVTTLAGTTYTPALTNIANITASTAFACQYLRVGSTVTVSGQVDIDPTAGATLTQLGISLPIPSAFSANEQCGGTAFAPVPAYGGAIFANIPSDIAELDFTTAADVANRSWWFTFTYRII